MLLSDDEEEEEEEGDNTDEGEGEISGSNDMDEPDDDQIRRADSRKQIGLTVGPQDHKGSVGRVNNFAMSNGVGDASKASIKKKQANPVVDQDGGSNENSLLSVPRFKKGNTGQNIASGSIVQHSKKASVNTES